MGLIAAALSSAGSVLADSWKEFFYVEALPDNVLVTRAWKRTNGKGSNHGNDNIISNGSGVAVADGQCAIIVDQGRVVEICAQPGEYTYNQSAEPSLFYGSLGKNILETFKAIGKRIGYGGATAREQRIFYVNTKFIQNNPFGTPQPIPFHLVDKSINLALDIQIQCNGIYTYTIADPILFYTNVCSNILDDYTRDKIDMTLRAEFMNALRPAIAQIAPLCTNYSDIGLYTEQLCNVMNEQLSEKWGQLRGIKVVNVAFNAINANEKDVEKINKLQMAAVNKDTSMAMANLINAQTESMMAAANNSAGAVTGFAGLNMAGGGGLDIASLLKQNAASQAASTPANGWTCSCGTVNTGKFCTECAKPKPASAAGWTCECGAVNQGKFCQECGKSKPSGAPLYRCDKCGWQPADPTNVPKFCPECGDVFDDNDKQ